MVIHFWSAVQAFFKRWGAFQGVFSVPGGENVVGFKLSTPLHASARLQTWVGLLTSDPCVSHVWKRFRHRPAVDN